MKRKVEKKRVYSEECNVCATVELSLCPVFTRVSEDGANFIVVIIGLVIIFKSQLTSLVESIFQKITSESAGI